MKGRLDSTLARVLALQAALLALVLLGAGALLTWIALDSGGAQLARHILGQLELADALLARGADDPATRRALAALDVRVAGSAPVDAVARLPLERRLHAALVGLSGEPERIRVASAPDRRAWLASRHAPGRWIGVPLTVHRSAVLGGALAILAGAALAAWLFAVLLARQLVRPLERLAGAAPAIVRGAADGDADAAAPREVRALAAALARAGAAARESARERELMLAGISHDLRTPLARLRLALELGDAGDPERRQAMVGDVEAMDAIVGQFLDYARLGSDEPRAPVDPAALCETLRRGRRLPQAWSVRVDAPAPLLARPVALARALANLCENAERHGAPPFEIRVGAADHARVFSVLDRGPGIAADRLDAVRRPFATGSAARGGGSGLGLPIAIRAAEQHGGALQLAARAGGGLEARLTLPD